MHKNCDIVCEGKVIAKIECGQEGIHIRHTPEGKEMCKGMKGCCH